MPIGWSHGNDPVVARIGVDASKGSTGKERFVTVHQCLRRLQAEHWFGMDMINWSQMKMVSLVTSTWEI